MPFFCMQVHESAHPRSTYMQLIYHLNTCSLFNKMVHVGEANSRNPTFSSTTQHSAFNVSNKLAENPLRIQIYEQILVTGHLDVHPDTHVDNGFLTVSLFLDNICGQIEAKLKMMEHGFCVEQAHFGHSEDLSPNSYPFERKSWFSETNFSRNCGWSFFEFMGSCYSSNEPLFLERGG